MLTQFPGVGIGLQQIVGEKNVLDNPESLKDYSEDHGSVPPGNLDM
jgi:hypothetical protein